MADFFHNKALLILGHGSSSHPLSSRSTREAARAIREKSLFGSVHCAFWKEKPGFQEIWPAIKEREVFVVPNFISEGYFTRDLIPRELGLSVSATAIRENHTIHYCSPPGIHAGMTQLVINKVVGTSSLPPEDTAVLLIGHGTEQNSNSGEAILSQERKIRQSGIPFAEIRSVFLDQSPLLAEWESLTSAAQVVAVPFFIAEGKHTLEDIPQILAAGNSDSRKIILTPPVGTDPEVIKMIVDQVRKFCKDDLRHCPE